MAESRQDTIAKGIQALELSVPESAPEQLAEYIELLARWNKAYNLTAVRDPDQMVPRHVLDSLSILPFVRGDRILDVGSGAGLPGIPLAIARPQWQFCLLDSNLKRTRFMSQAVMELGLKNVSVQRSRIEDYKLDVLFDSVISRAFTRLEGFVKAVSRLCAADGCMLAMKGEADAKELDELAGMARIVATHPLVVPGLTGARHLIHCENLAEQAVGDD